MSSEQRRGDEEGNCYDEQFVKNFPTNSEKLTGICLEESSQLSQLLHEYSSNASFAAQKVSSNVVPVSVEASTSTNRILKDRLHLLQVFPEDVWFMISEKLDDKDLEKLSNSSLFLRELFLQQRVQFMFRNVWGIVERTYEKTAVLSSREDYFQLLGLRFVCRAWNNVYEGLYQQAPNGALNEYRIRETNTISMSGKNKHRVDSLADDSSYVTTCRNPFFARLIEVHDWGENSEDLFNAIFCVLRTYGHHVWYCTIDVLGEGEFYAPAEWHSKIRSILELMPNLKMLNFERYPRTLRELSQNQLQEFENEVNLRPFPRLEYLQKLITHYLPTSVFQDLVRQNSHVSALEIWRFREHVDYEIYNQPLPNLSELRIGFRTQEDFRKLTNPQVNWPLKKLVLHLDEIFSFDWQMAFTVLSDKFAGTLNQLTLSLPENMSKVDMRVHQLNLPNLTDLTLDMYTLTCLDFLLPMQQSLIDFTLRIPINGLKKKHVVNLAERVENGNVIKLLSCAKSGSETNIWTIFPKLRELDFYFSAAGDTILKLKGSKNP